MNELTREQILAMPAGRELDALVAEHVMGWKVTPYNPDYHIEYKDEHGNLLVAQMSEFQPSSDIAAAWEVWTHKHPEHWQMNIFEHNGQFTCDIIEVTEEMGYKYLAQFESKSVEEAMVKCRLLAVMGL